MRADLIRGADNRTEIVGVLNAVEQYQEGILALFPRASENTAEFRIRIARDHRDDTLVLSVFAHAIQTLFVRVEYAAALLFCLSHDAEKRAVL